MTDEQIKINNDFQIKLSQFIGTTHYHYVEPFRKLNYTDGVKYFFTQGGQDGAYWFAVIVATEIMQKLPEDFYIIEIDVKKEDTTIITVKRDINEPILYKKELDYTDLMPVIDEPYKFYLSHYPSDKSVLLLPSEY